MKIYSYLALFIFVGLSLIPPINFIISNPPLEYWLWLVLIAGFLGFFTLFLRIHWVVKVIAIASFVNCFFSVIPYLSFSSYISVIACCYFYILCTKVIDWSIIFKALQTVVFLNVFLIGMQYLHHDPLLNFGVFHMEQYGILGQHMQMASFLVVTSSLLLTFSKFNILIPIVLSIFCHSSWAFITAGAGIVIYIFHKNVQMAGSFLLIVLLLFGVWIVKDRKVGENLDSNSGRVEVWKRSIELSAQRPLTGWGIGTYKDLFHPLSKMNCTPWRNAHNFIIQLVFEIGYPLTICLLFGLGWLLYALFKAGLWLLLSGLSMIVIDALIHFPDRMIQCVPLIILFVAYCQFNLRRYA